MSSTINLKSLSREHIILLNKSYQNKKQLFHTYINNIKASNKHDIYTIINSTLIKNPYITNFPKKFFLNFDCVKKENNFFLFLRSSFKFYIKQYYLLLAYFIGFVIFKLFCKKNRTTDLKIIIDIFGLVDKTIKEGEFSENYLTGIYDLFEQHNTQYAILLRLYNVGKNPFKLIKFFKIVNNDKRDFIFEYELISFLDFFRLFFIIFLYPFKTLRLLQKEKNGYDIIFNNSLLHDIKNFNFNAFSRHILGKNIAKIDSIEKIFSWSEFQVIERSFNYAIRANNKNIELIGLQFFLSYETYFNVIVDDLDYEMQSSPHKVLVNGRYYIQERKKVKYDLGVSLRYKNIFKFSRIEKEKNILLLGSYFENDTKYMLDSVSNFDNVIFKNHPAVDIKKLGTLPKNISVSNENIYKLFKTTQLTIGTASGTAVEAVACGISVIIIASQDNLTANPLVEFGRGKIWDIAFNESDVKRLYNNLINYRKNNKEEIKSISEWYKYNFFVEPTEESIIKTLELDMDI